jgi:hypothetical protein
MMNNDALKALAIETVQSPRSAAQKIMGLNYSRDVLWSALVLVACLNSIIYSLTPLTVDAQALPSLMRNPIMFFVLVAGLQVFTVHGFYWGGRIIGGQGDLGEMLSLMVWVQALQAAANAVLLVLLFISPGIEQLLSFAVGIFGLWITLNFITEALRLPGLWHAIGVLFIATMGIAFGLVILVSMIGLGAMGVPTNV